MIYGGFTYNGKHSYRDMGIIAQTGDRPLLPPQKTVQEGAPWNDGKDDFTAINPLERVLYDNKTVTVSCKFKRCGSYEDMQRQVARISTWLANLRGGYGELIFDDMPEVVWRAKPTNNIPLQLQYAAVGSFSLSFDCLPFNTMTFDSDSLVLDTDIPLDSNFQLGDDYDLRDDMSISLYSASAPSRPVVEIEGKGDNISISCNDRTIGYNKAFDGTLIFDCSQYICTLNGLPVEIDGTYFELFEGENIIRIQGNNLSGTMTCIYPYNLFYGLDDITLEDITND